MTTHPASESYRWTEPRLQPGCPVAAQVRGSAPLLTWAFVSEHLRTLPAGTGLRVAILCPPTVLIVLTAWLVALARYVRRDPARALGLVVDLVTILDWIVGGIS